MIAIYIVALIAAAFLFFTVLGGQQQVDTQSTQAPTANYQGINSGIVQQFAQAIASAEGYGVAGAIPTLANNPGDLELGDLGNGTLGEGITVFSTIANGWAALYNQVGLMFSGKSKVYAPSMSISQVGNSYSGGDPNWAINVAAFLGVTTDTTLQSLLDNQ